MTRGRAPSEHEEDTAIPAMMRCAGCGEKFYGICVDRCYRCRSERRQANAQALGATGPNAATAKREPNPSGQRNAR